MLNRYQTLPEMFRTLALLCLVAASVHGTSDWEGNLRVRFDLTLAGFGTTAFIELPKSDTKAADDGWVVTKRPHGPAGYSSLVMWCPKDDYTICVLIDDTGYIAGMQIAVDTERFIDGALEWTAQGFTYWSTEINGVPKNYWTTQQYYISVDNLKTDAATRIANRDPHSMLQDTAVYVSGFYGELYAITTNATDIIVGNSDFTEQACTPLMGVHYYYKMTEDLECRPDVMLPWFTLVDNNQLIGIGLGMFVKPIKEVAKEWFEISNSAVAQAIVPRAPQCMYDMAHNPGLVTLHTYFIDKPYLSTCAA